jgi:putative tryptophan/tyrosine transport system substrate-binding protein
VKRREFITLLSGAAAWPLAAGAQQPVRVRLVGVLMSLAQNDPGGQAEVEAFYQGLTALGWVEGRNIQIEFRWAGGNIERARILAKELIGLNPDVLLGRSTPTTAALKAETNSIPIIFVNVAEPIRSGFVESLIRPGGNLTGFTNFDGSIGAKWLQLLKEVAPNTTRVASIYNPQTAPFAASFLESTKSAASSLGVETIAVAVLDDADIEASLTTFARQPAGGLIAIPDSFTMEHRHVIIAQAAKHRLPALYANRLSALDGGLMSYAVDTRGLFQRSAGYVDRILNGAKPSELPVQMPTKFDLVINLKTAKALGLDLPPMLIARADEVIE